jgi:uncharacterized Zn finger protein (UPF0148 family)
MPNPDGTAKAKPSKGKKFCPKCGVEIHSACRKHDCGWMSEKWRKKTKQIATEKKPKVIPTIVDRLMEIDAAIALVEKLGGIEEAKKKVAIVKELAKL